MILVRLRNPLIREAKTVADLLPRVNMTMADEVETEMTSLFGQGVLWVLDGWDELPSDLPLDSIIKKLIQPDMLQESPLHQSAVIVTSRPSNSSSAGLHPLVSSRVEVLGFTPHELEQYFRECLKGDTRAAQTLLERIRENPVVEGSCYLPLNAAIVVHVFLSGDHSLPTSKHGIFIEVIKNSLKRYLQDKLGIMTCVENTTSLDLLPLEIQNPVADLCHLAFHGISSNKITFCESDLTSLSVSNDISKYGLLQSVSSIVSNGHQTYFSFLHLSIQELLAAVHISHMSPKQQISVFQELFGTPGFSAVFQFYAGITKLRVSRPLLSKLPRLLCPVPTSVYGLVRKVVKENHSKPLLVSLLHCLYEAEDSTLCMFVADLLHNSLSLLQNTLTPLDSLSIGYFLSVVSTTVSGVFTVNLENCSIGDQGCKFLVQGLSKCLNTHSKITLQLDVNLSNNFIHEEGAHHIAQLLKNITVVNKLNMSSNPFGEDGLKSLCDALSTSTTLETLEVSGCSLSLNEENGLLLKQLLSANKSLIRLDLSRNIVTDCHHIAAGLSNNQTLRALELNHCRLSDRTIQELSTGLTEGIEELYIRGNDLATINKPKTWALRCRLTRTRNWVLLLCLKPSIRRVFSNVNKERTRNGIPEIKVFGE